MNWLMERASVWMLAGLVLAGANAMAAAQEPEAVPGEYVVRLKEAHNLKGERISLQVLSERLGSFIKTTIPDQNIVVIKRPVFETREAVLKTLAENDLVDIVEPNFIYHASRVPNDPLLGQLWGMSNSGQQDSDKQVGVSGVDISAEQAWDIETGSKDVLVAVIDTGINYNSPDLKDNVWTNQAEANGIAGVDDDNNGYVDDIHGYNFVANTGDPLDDMGHGSHCSGTIGAKGNDGQGLVGVNWDVQIMAVKFLDASGSGSLDNALKAIDYATKMGAKIMSNSWGGGGYSDTLKAAIDRSNDAGALFVAAAGNDGSNNDITPSYPASYPEDNVLSVAAVDNRGNLASFSNYGGNSVHVAAPGVNILSVTTVGYESWSGTSMATPHVTGIAALLLAHDPTMTSADLKNRIITTVKPMQSLRGQVRSAGMVNAYTALTNTVPPPDPNDPTNWQSVPVSVSTAHPYTSNEKDTYNVSVPGAKQISLYFANFDTERNFDKAEIFDSTGKSVQVISGGFSNSFSNVIDGDSAKIVFTSDNSVNRNGFDLTKAAWR